MPLTHIVQTYKGEMVRQNKSGIQLSAIEQVIATALLNRELYGMEIVRRIWQAAGSSLQISQTSIYPTLQRMEESGILASRWETTTHKNPRPCKYYKLSREGEKAIQDILRLYAKLQEYEPETRSEVKSKRR